MKNANHANDLKPEGIVSNMIAYQAAKASSAAAIYHIANGNADAAYLAARQAASVMAAAHLYF